MGGSVYEVDPGKKLWLYHLHHANEEWMVVLRGRPTLRTPEGEHELVEGDVVCFVRGAAGAHQVRNETEEPVRGRRDVNRLSGRRSVACASVRERPLTSLPVNPSRPQSRKAPLYVRWRADR